MERRKNPAKDLGKKSPMFFHIGLITSLMLVILAFEWQMPEPPPAVDVIEGVASEEIMRPITEIEPPKPKPKPKIFTPVETKEEPEIEIDDPIFDDEYLEDIPLDLPIAEETEEKVEEPPFLLHAEEMPEPKGGMAAFYKYLKKNVKYPRQARRLDITGKVFVSFIVDEEGRLRDIKVIKGIGAGCDEEAMRVLEKAPAWKPGKQRFKPVKVKMSMAIVFDMN